MINTNNTVEDEIIDEYDESFLSDEDLEEERILRECSNDPSDFDEPDFTGPISDDYDR